MYGLESPGQMLGLTPTLSMVSPALKTSGATAGIGGVGYAQAPEEKAHEKASKRKRKASAAMKKVGRKRKASKVIKDEEESDGSKRVKRLELNR